MRGAIAEVLDVGVWTWGIVSIAAVAVEFGIEALVGVLVGVLVLGVSGRAAVGTIDRLARRSDVE